EKDRHRAEIERHCAEPEEMRGDARCFAANRADRFSARWNVPAHQFFHCERVGYIVRERREIIEPVGVRHELVVLHVLGDLLVATMKKANVRRRLRDHLAVELQHKSQNAVRGWMRRPHVEDHLLANIVVPRLAQCRVDRGYSRNRVWRFDLARRKWHGRRSYNVPGKIYAGGWNFVPQAIFGERAFAACWR